VHCPRLGFRRERHLRAALPFARQAGSLKAYAATSNTRLTAAPDIPTFAELGFPRVSLSAWNGLYAPKGTPKDIIGKLNAAAVEALADRAVRSRLAELGQEVFPPEQIESHLLRAAAVRDLTASWPPGSHRGPSPPGGE
jgi:tripartite-type tricarboxylate transporter receptor subunit TctC